MGVDIKLPSWLPEKLEVSAIPSNSETSGSVDNARLMVLELSSNCAQFLLAGGSKWLSNANDDMKSSKIWYHFLLPCDDGEE